MTQGDREPTGPLAGLVVIEMGSLVAAPFCAQLLGDLGAEVIKVEIPRRGDPMREWGQEKQHGRSLWWPVIARNKKSVTCDLRRPEGRSLGLQLLEGADVLVENFRAGTLEKWGLGPDILEERNPDLICARVTGFGQDGPLAERPGYGSIGEAMGGLRYVTGDPSVPPSRVGISIGDSLAGLFATVGVLAALHARNESGGQVVDAAIYESVLGVMESLIPEYALGGYVRERTGPVLPRIAPSNIYPTRDDAMILIAANQDTVFKRLARAMGAPELADDERFATHTSRGQNQDELDDLIRDWTCGLRTAEIVARLEAESVPHGKIYTAADMLDDPHFEARESIVTVPHPTFGDFPMANVFPRLSKTPGSVQWPGPELGEHNREVYSRIGVSTDRQERLENAGVI